MFGAMGIRLFRVNRFFKEPEHQKALKYLGPWGSGSLGAWG